MIGYKVVHLRHGRGWRPIMTLEDAKRMNELLHNKWTRDVGSAGYDKTTWLELCVLVEKATREATRRDDWNTAIC